MRYQEIQITDPNTSRIRNAVMWCINFDIDSEINKCEIIEHISWWLMNISPKRKNKNTVFNTNNFSLNIFENTLDIRLGKAASWGYMHVGNFDLILTEDGKIFFQTDNILKDEYNRCINS